MHHVKVHGSPELHVVQGAKNHARCPELHGVHAGKVKEETYAELDETRDNTFHYFCVFVRCRARDYLGSTDVYF
jgi:hypothetical protein